MSKLYLAYGSNLNKKQMAVRCPTARPVGSAMIYGWELVFRGVADIVKSKDENMCVPVGLWELEMFMKAIVILMTVIFTTRLRSLAS